MNEKKHEFDTEALSSLPRELQEYLLRTSQEPESVLDFFNGVVAGDCPVCGGFNTRQGSDTPLDDPTVGICLDCFSMTCLDCGEVFENGQTVCEHLKVCDACKSGGKRECNIPVWDCPRIERWKTERKHKKESKTDSAGASVNQIQTRKRGPTGE
jgi:hypothetical protein